MRGHELIEHTADEGLHVWALSLEELFAEAAIALIAVMGDGRGEAAHQQIQLDAPDLDALFVDWLSEVLFLFEARSFVPTEIRVTLDGTHLAATLDGVTATSFDQTGPAVKAVTYHGLQINRMETGYEAYVYIDV